MCEVKVPELKWKHGAVCECVLTVLYAIVLYSKIVLITVLSFQLSSAVFLYTGHAHRTEGKYSPLSAVFYMFRCQVSWKADYKPL